MVLKTRGRKRGFGCNNTKPQPAGPMNKEQEGNTHRGHAVTPRSAGDFTTPLVVCKAKKKSLISGISHIAALSAHRIIITADRLDISWAINVCKTCLYSNPSCSTCT